MKLKRDFEMYCDYRLDHKKAGFRQANMVVSGTTRGGLYKNGYFYFHGPRPLFAVANDTLLFLGKDGQY